MRVKENLRCKEVVKTRVALYTKVIDSACSCMYSGKNLRMQLVWATRVPFKL